MAQALFHKVDYPLNKLIEDIDLGEIALPDIQRPFVWPNIKVRDLFDSMYRGYPIGYFLFWENGLQGEYQVIGTNRKQKAPHLLVVDGQQRLTSLYAVLKGKPVIRSNYHEERIIIAFNPREGRFEVTNNAISRDPKWIADISQLWDTDTSHNKFAKAFLAGLRQSQEVSETAEDEISDAIFRLYAAQNYQLTVLELSSTVPEDQVAEIFVRINSKGTPLNQADFILTLLSVFWDDGRADLERFCRRAKQPSAGGPSPFNHFIRPDPDQLLRAAVALGFQRARLEHVYSLLRGKDLQTGGFSEEQRVKQFTILRNAQTYVLDLQNWHDFFKALLRAGYRSGAMISSQTAIVYTYALYLIGKYDFKVEASTLRDTIARWFFMVSLTGRYTASPETRMEQDLALLRGLNHPAQFIAALDREIGAVLTADHWGITLANELATSSPRSPALFAYYAALNLLDAQVLFSKMKVTDLLDPSIKAKKSALERHHLFPRRYLKKAGIAERREINQIANYALVEWSDNITISDLPPSDYAPEYEARLPREELERTYSWHALPRGWYEMDYATFLEERRKLMAHVIRRGFETLEGGG
jgi:hypothetical protein